MPAPLQLTPEALTRRVAKLSGLLDVAKAMTAARDLDPLLELVLESAKRVVDADRCTLFLVDRHHAHLRGGRDEQAGNGEQLLSKLERGRVGLALLQDDQARALLAQAPAGRFEVLARPFEELTLYLMLSRDFERRHPGLAPKAPEALAGRSP